MGRSQIEKSTIPSLEGYTKVYYCPANGQTDVDINFSGTLRAFGGDPVGKTKKIPCRYDITDPVHVDLTAIVAIPISAVADGHFQVRQVALAKAQEIFRPSQ